MTKHIRGIDYTQRITGGKLTNSAIEKYALEGKYGPNRQLQAKQLLISRKTKSTSNKKCKSVQTLTPAYIDSLKGLLDDTNQS